MKLVATFAVALAALALLPTASADPLPSTPEWIQAQYDDGAQTLSITWATVEGAAYNLYRDGSLVAKLTSPSYTDVAAQLGAVEYQVTAVTDAGESLPATVTWVASTAGNAALLLAPPSVVHLVLFAGGDPCEPITLGSSSPPWVVGIDWRCLEDVLHH